MECQEGRRWDDDRDNRSQYTCRKATACEELEKTRDSAGVAEETLLMMTVQAKILLLLKLLRDWVKVEAVIGNDSHAQN